MNYMVILPKQAEQIGKRNFVVYIAGNIGIKTVVGPEEAKYEFEVPDGKSLRAELGIEHAKLIGGDLTIYKSDTLEVGPSSHMFKKQEAEENILRSSVKKKLIDENTID